MKSLQPFSVQRRGFQQFVSYFLISESKLGTEQILQRNTFDFVGNQATDFFYVSSGRYDVQLRVSTKLGYQLISSVKLQTEDMSEYYRIWFRRRVLRNGPGRSSDHDQANGDILCDLYQRTKKAVNWIRQPVRFDCSGSYSSLSVSTSILPQYSQTIIFFLEAISNCL